VILTRFRPKFWRETPFSASFPPQIPQGIPWNFKRSTAIKKPRLPLRISAWSRVPLEKLTGSQLVKKFPAFYGNRRFNTAFTSAGHLSLS